MKTEANGKPATAMELELERIIPDPEQPRKQFDAVKMSELTDSIREHGVIQRLLVRKGDWFVEPGRSSGKDCWFVINREWIRPKGEYLGPSIFKPTKAEAEKLLPLYVLIAGERRLKAAKAAGLKTVPADLRDGEKNGWALQMIENLQRENLSALAEAEAFRKRIEAGTKPEEVAKELGVSRATVFGRLVLTRLHKPVREALVAGQISTSVAGLVAMVPEPAKQEELLKEILSPLKYNEEPLSFRQVQEEIGEKYCRQLKDAKFDLKKQFRPFHGMVCATCQDCPRRSGNMVDSYPELAKRPNVCTQPACFEAKMKIHTDEVLSQARKEGKPIVEGKAFDKYNHLNPAFVDITDKYNVYHKGQYVSYQSLLGKNAPAPALAVDNHGNVRNVWTQSAVQSALKAKGIKIQSSSGRNDEYAKKRRKEAEARQKKEELGRHVLRIVLEKVMAKQADSFEKVCLRFIVSDYAENYYGAGEIEKMIGLEDKLDKVSRIESLSVAQLRAAALAFCITQDHDCGVDYNGGWSKKLKQVAQMAGVDLKVAEKAAEKAVVEEKTKQTKTKGKK